MKITREQVLHVASLARLSFTEEEAERFTDQMGAILEYVEQLNEPDVSGVEPMAHVHDIVNAFRDDRVSPSLPNEKALSASALTEDGCFRVPKVIEG